jgi:ABC-type lipoprotein release transport system permease subunit
LNLTTLVTRSASYHWRTNLAIVLGVAAAVSVLAGALLVGDSVRGSLRDIALGRLGRTDAVIASVGFFREGLADDVRQAAGVEGAAPLIVANGFVTNESSGRRAGSVLVYGVDERFWRFHGLEPVEGVYASPALAQEIGAKDGDVLLTRLQRPSEIPIESLFGRKDETGRTVRLTLAGVSPPAQLGEFALQPQQSAIRAVFAPLRRIQRDLGVAEQVNTILIAGPAPGDPLRDSLRLDDLGARVVALPDLDAVAVESTSGIVNDALERAARNAGQKLGLQPVPVFTYLANSIRRGDRVVPYSLITATDLAALPADAAPRRPVEQLREARQQDDGIVLNVWTARELDAKAGDRIDIDYYLWDPAAGLLTKTASFTLAGVVPIAGAAADRRLAPDYPGISDSASLADWDPPFPIDLSRVRPQDERYWDDYRTTPKGFISYERGRELWSSRYGALTSIRFRTSGDAVQRAAAALGAELGDTLSAPAMGVSIYPARRLALEASAGATDFGEYFTYFSFFLVVSALMLAVLFFKLGVEGRLKQIGVMRAAGYTIPVVRRLFLMEALILSVLGALVGVAGAIGYANAIVYGLKTWWRGAVGTQLLDLHVSGMSLAVGAAGGVVAALLCVFVSLRAVARLTPRALLTAQSLDTTGAGSGSAAGPVRARRLAAIMLAAGVLLLALGFISRAAQAGAFFGAGAALLVASLLFLSGWLRERDAKPITGRGAWPVSRLGFRSAAFRPGRSVLSAALIASAAFIIVSVEAFRRGGGELTQDPKSGTGGYALLARSELPIVHNPNEADGREALLIQAPELARTHFTRFRVRQGQDASCLNLYRPTNPTLVGAESSFIDAGRFSFSASLAETDDERANPWRLLRRTFDDGSVPVVADATSLQYVLHASVGDTFSMDIGSERPLVLRFVGALQDSVLQGELIMAEEQFVRLFPGQQGYRLFLVSDPGVASLEQAAQLSGVLEKELETFGVDAVATTERLEEFHRVENTYLSTFQALGGLGLLLGTIGLATVMFRNVLERRRELALLRAVGFDARNVSRMILAESVFLLGAGLLMGGACAAIAIAPAWLGRGGETPGTGLLLLFGAVIASGLLSSLVATRAALSGRILDGLRAE